MVKPSEYGQSSDLWNTTLFSEDKIFVSQLIRNTGKPVMRRLVHSISLRFSASQEEVSARFIHQTN